MYFENYIKTEIIYVIDGISNTNFGIWETLIYKIINESEILYSLMDIPNNEDINCAELISKDKNHRIELVPKFEESKTTIIHLGDVSKLKYDFRNINYNIYCILYTSNKHVINRQLSNPILKYTSGLFCDFFPDELIGFDNNIDLIFFPNFINNKKFYDKSNCCESDNSLVLINHDSNEFVKYKRYESIINFNKTNKVIYFNSEDFNISELKTSIIGIYFKKIITFNIPPNVLQYVDHYCMTKELLIICDNNHPFSNIRYILSNTLYKANIININNKGTNLREIFKKILRNCDNDSGLFVINFDNMLNLIKNYFSKQHIFIKNSFDLLHLKNNFLSLNYNIVCEIYNLLLLIDYYNYKIENRVTSHYIKLILSELIKSTSNRDLSLIYFLHNHYGEIFTKVYEELLKENKIERKKHFKFECYKDNLSKKFNLQFKQQDETDFFETFCNTYLLDNIVHNLNTFFVIKLYNFFLHNNELFQKFELSCGNTMKNLIPSNRFTEKLYIVYNLKIHRSINIKNIKFLSKNSIQNIIIDFIIYNSKINIDRELILKLIENNACKVLKIYLNLLYNYNEVKSININKNDFNIFYSNKLPYFSKLIIIQSIFSNSDSKYKNSLLEHLINKNRLNNYIYNGSSIINISLDQELSRNLY